MFGKIVKTYFIATALSPVCFSLSYVISLKHGFLPWGLAALAVAAALGGSCLGIVNLAKKHLETLPITIKKAKSADKDVIGFFVAYVLPLFFAKTVTLEPAAIFIFIAMLAFVIWGTHSIQVNPLLGVFGYHFYEVDSESGISFLLVTKRKIVNVKSVRCVVQLTEYLILDRS
ncbi:hypothetical protein [Burkholderia multivorans]|uniref:hypothetical protein n=1 Tax=Burkholderiaceae TaxID=119060 RepID=UPI000B08CBB3|nr:hypothetical protein [Burkholderia multivorans]MDR9229617.1 hypothetical protein [Burkholderia multivorans]HDR9473299.1 hypothetical protein [Burkholderia multivorans]